MGEKLGFRDIIDLAKAGYKPADVKELLQLANAQPEAAEKDPEILQKDAAQPEDQKAEAAESKVQVEQKEDDTLKNLQNQIAEMQKKADEKDALIKQIQKDNSSKNIQNTTKAEKTNDEIVTELVRAFM